MHPIECVQLKRSVPETGDATTTATKLSEIILHGTYRYFDVIAKCFPWPKVSNSG
jgi:hypothetical protein